MEECKGPAHLSENEKYQIIADIVFKMISERAIAHMRKYLDADYKYHLLNKVTPLVEESLKRREEIVKEYLNNNSVATVMIAATELKEQANELRLATVGAKSIHEKNSRESVVKAVRDALIYSLDHECEEDYD